MITQKHLLPASRFDKGFVVLASVLAVSLIGMALVLSLLLTSTSTTRSSRTLEEGRRARAYADACGEHALNKLKSDTNYSGETLTFTDGTCAINAILGNGSANRTIQATGTTGNITKRISIFASQTTPTPTVTSWEEVANF